MRSIKLIGALPIAVGHRVRVTYFRVIREKRGFLGTSGAEDARIDAPQIVDLETEIVYAHGDFAKVSGRLVHLDRTNVEALGLRDEAVEVESFEGVVRACQITVLNNELTETWLDVEPRAP